MYYSACFVAFGCTRDIVLIAFKVEIKHFSKIFGNYFLSFENFQKCNKITIYSFPLLKLMYGSRDLSLFLKKSRLLSTHFLQKRGALQCSEIQ